MDKPACRRGHSPSTSLKSDSSDAALLAREFIPGRGLLWRFRLAPSPALPRFAREGATALRRLKLATRRRARLGNAGFQPAIDFICRRDAGAPSRVLCICPSQHVETPRQHPGIP
jgi:hypothetical protein